MVEPVPTFFLQELEHEEGIEPVALPFCRRLTYHLSIRANSILFPCHNLHAPSGVRERPRLHYFLHGEAEVYRDIQPAFELTRQIQEVSLPQSEMRLPRRKVFALALR